jgi:adenine-specific DNA-methyltransferase
MSNVKGGRYVESLYFPIVNPRNGQEHYPSSNGNWRFNSATIKSLIESNEIYFGEDDCGRPKLKRFLKDVKDGITWTTLWDFAPLFGDNYPSALTTIRIPGVAGGNFLLPGGGQNGRRP